MTAQTQVCPECDAAIKGGICLSCGHVFDKTSYSKIEKISKKQADEIDKDNENIESVSDEEPELEKPQVRSIFADVKAYDDDAPIKKSESKPAKNQLALPLVLAILLLALGGLSYWRFIYFKPEFVSPVVLSMTDGEATFYQTNTRTLEFDPELVEGNFEVNNYAQFAALDIKTFIQAFDIKHAFSKFERDGLVQEILSEFNIEEDDLDVYFSNGFALLFPNDELDTWGFVIETQNKDYVESRIAAFRQRKENPNYEFVNYYADLVEISGEITPVIDEEMQEVEVNEEDMEESAEEESVVEQEAPTSKFYLLVSNSNEYLDQMKESSEGNLANLASELKFTNSRLDLPVLGAVYVYRDVSSPISSRLANIVQSMYSYEGLDRILNSIQSSGIAFSTSESRLRITISGN